MSGKPNAELVKLVANHRGVRFEKELKEFAEEIGIPIEGDWSILAMHIATKNFLGSRKAKRRGRPPLKAGKGGQDYDRYKAIVAYIRDNSLPPSQKMAVLIRKFQESGDPLFALDEFSLSQSVSRGKRIWKKAQREQERLLVEFEHMKAARQEAEAEAAVRKQILDKQKAEMPALGLLSLNYLKPNQT